MTTNRCTPIVRAMTGELFDMLWVEDGYSSISPPDTFEHGKPGQLDVLYMGYTMRIIVEERKPESEEIT